MNLDLANLTVDLHAACTIAVAITSAIEAQGSSVPAGMRSAIDALAEQVFASDMLGNPERYEIKEIRVDVLGVRVLRDDSEQAALVAVRVVSGLKNDEGTMAEVFARDTRHVFIRRQGAMEAARCGGANVKGRDALFTRWEERKAERPATGKEGSVKATILAIFAQPMTPAQARAALPNVKPNTLNRQIQLAHAARVLTRLDGSRYVLTTTIAPEAM